MSSPDNVARLRAKVEVYESELQETAKGLSYSPQGRDQFQQSMWAAALMRFFDVNGKLLNAYREYTRELEKLAPR